MKVTLASRAVGFAVVALILLLSLGSIGVAAEATVVLSNLRVPYGLFADKDGNLYFVEFGEPRASTGVLKKLSPEAVEPTVLLKNLTNPYAVGMDEHGNLYFTDRTGTLTLLRAGATEPEVVMTGLGRIYGLAVDQKGDLYLALFGSPLGGGDGAIAKLPSPTRGTAQDLEMLATGLNHPVGVAVDARGDVYFTEYGLNGTIKKLTASGDVLTLLQPATTAAGLAVDRLGNIYYADASTGVVNMLKKGEPAPRILVSGISGPWAIALSPTGKLYIAEKSTNGSILVVDTPQPLPYDLTLILALAIVGALAPVVISVARARNKRETGPIQQRREKPHGKP